MFKVGEMLLFPFLELLSIHLKHLLLDLHSLALGPEHKQMKHLPLDRNIAFLEAGFVMMLRFAFECFCLQTYM